MNFLGAHVSTSGGLFQAPIRAMAIKGNAFAMFVKNQKRWFDSPLNAAEIDLFKKKIANHFKVENILVHAGYLINLANSSLDKRELSIKSLIAEMNRCKELGLKLLVLHPGSTLKQISEETGLALIAESLNQVLKQTTEIEILLENTAGQGGNLGYNFRQLKTILEKVNSSNRVGVCLDTCHLFAAGYDLNDNFSTLVKEIKGELGTSVVKGLHLNNSLQKCGSRLDRHASLLDGYIKPAFFRWIVEEEFFNALPMILETPFPEKWAEEIEWLRYGKNS